MRRSPVILGTLLALTSLTEARSLFGMQSIPKFDERTQIGSWAGSRARGMRMHQELGVELSREGMIWMHYEPERGKSPYQDDFDDAVNRLTKAGVAIEEMITDCPFWASSAQNKDSSNPASYKNAPPIGLYCSVFQDGTDFPAPGKQVNSENPWAVFIDRMSRRYCGKVAYYQVWNEPDFPKGELGKGTSPERSWQGSVDEYVRLLQVASIVIRRNDPKALVVLGGLGYANYLDAVLLRGGGRYFDAVDFHAYGFPGSDVGIKEFLRVHTEMVQCLKRRGQKKRLLCSETGYSSAEPDEQADYITKVFATSLALGLDATCYYTNLNPCWKEMGLIDWRTMSRPTKGYWAYRTAARALKEAKYIKKLPLRPEAVGYLFERQGKPFAVAWAPYRDGIKIKWPLSGSWRVFDAVGVSKGSVKRELTLSKHPVYLEGDVRFAYPTPRPTPRKPLACIFAESLPDYPIEWAIDGNPDTQWVHSGFQSPTADILWDLGRKKALKSISIKTGPMGNASLDILVSEDKQRFVPVFQGLSISDWGMHTYSFQGQGRWIKVLFHNGQPPLEHFQVFEIGIQ